MKPLTLSKVNCKFGAPMGRIDILPLNNKASGRLQMHKLQWVDYSYDEGGAYWGHSNDGTDIYHAEGLLNGEIEPTVLFIRAISRKEAKKIINNRFPNIKFYR